MLCCGYKLELNSSYLSSLYLKLEERSLYCETQLSISVDHF